MLAARQAEEDAVTLRALPPTRLNARELGGWLQRAAAAAGTAKAAWHRPEVNAASGLPSAAAGRPRPERRTSIHK